LITKTKAAEADGNAIKIAALDGSPDGMKLTMEQMMSINIMDTENKKKS